MTNTFSFTFSGEEIGRGTWVKKNGWKGEGEVIAFEPKRALVVSWKGYGENPGSRYSGLRDYYPANTEVFEFVETDVHGRDRYRLVIGWLNRKQKEKQSMQRL